MTDAGRRPQLHRQEDRPPVGEEGMSEVERWLEGLGLAGYAPAFAGQHIEFDLLADLGDDDLKQLGVEALGHRKRLLRAIAALAGSAKPAPGAASAPAASATLARDA